MRLIEELRAEHLLIERVLGALRTFAGCRARGEATPADGMGFVRFFRLYAGSFHHAREEDTLFPALRKRLELPETSGPTFSLTDQHRRMEGTLGELAPLLAGEIRTKEEGDELVRLVTLYAHSLLAHIDAENSVLLPEGEERLRHAGVHNLDGRPPTSAETEARREGEKLATLYPPSEDPGAIRGEGCAICPSYGTTCGGLEREWWSEDEWEAFESREG